MPTLKLHQRIHQDLKQKILQNIIAPGTFLSPEPELAKQYAVSRGTLRIALEHLAQEGWIERVPKVGTRICKKRPCTLLTYLLPCQFSMIQTMSFNFAQTLHALLLEGIIGTLKNHHAKLEMLPVSKTNEPEDIDWEMLYNLDENSKLILPGAWYQHLFAYCQRLKCSTLLIHEKNYILPENRPAMKDFTQLILDNQEMMQRITAFQIQRGSRHPAIQEAPEADLDKERVKGFQKALKQTGLKDSDGVILPAIPLPANQQYSEEYAMRTLETILEAYERTPFDSLILEGNLLFLMQRFGLWEKHQDFLDTMLWGTFNSNSYFLPLYPNLAAINFNHVRLGAEAAELLLNPTMAGMTKTYLADEITLMNTN